MKKKRGTGELPPAPPAGQGDLFGGVLKVAVAASKPPPEPPPAPAPPPAPSELKDVSGALPSLPGAPTRTAPTRTVLTVGELTQQLKERLAAEGLIGDNRIRPPRPLPSLPRRIGVVTSRTGAALQDFLRVLHSRHPRLSAVLRCGGAAQDTH